MMVLWDKKQINVKELGEYLYLDSGTLTPLLKKLEQKGFITREKNTTDERNLNVCLTKEGENLKNIAKTIPSNVSKCIELSEEDAINLYKILHKILENIK